MTLTRHQETKQAGEGEPPRAAGMPAPASTVPDAAGRLRDQPRAVWAVAFACVVSFMGIGLVDPILPVIAQDLNAGPEQVSMLFTSYMLVTGLFMLVSGFVSSRIGAKRTLLIGLVFVVVFAAGAGLSGSVPQIIALRGGWGIGNALFIATALATIVGAATGGSARAVMMYEAAMGIGMAAGPLVGGLLGSVSWRAPFFGTASMMAVAFILVTVLLPKTAKPARPQPFKAPFVALRHPGLFRLSATAFLYNMGFFVLLSQAPYPLEDLGALGIGLVFFGWGIALAAGSVAVGPALHRAFGRLRVLQGAVLCLGLVLGGMALTTHAEVWFICLIVTGGMALGICNTLLTESVMEVSDVASSVASAGYSAVRFTGGAVATFVAGWLTQHVSIQVSLGYGAIAELAALILLLASVSALRHIDRNAVERMDTAGLDDVSEAEALTAADS